MLGTLREDQHTVFDHSSLISSWNEMFQKKNYKENQNTHFMFNKVFPEMGPFMR